MKRFERKTIEELEKLNTERLLRYYKAERRRFYSAGYWCGCGCGDFIWEAYPKDTQTENKYKEHLSYLESIKSILDKREHVVLNKK